ncbi:MAG: NADH-quinone oxidoreductase subunit L [Gemmataceae bacterium]|nr:NADH-quinone oxidoreductase subunit L [Gemmataceae bacterium]
MEWDFGQHPGLIFVVATLLPLASFALLLLAGAARAYLRSIKAEGSLSERLFAWLGGEATGRGPAWIATAAIALACVCSVVGFVWFLADAHDVHEKVHHAKAEIKNLETKAKNVSAPDGAKTSPKKKHDHDHDHDHDKHEAGKGHGAAGKTLSQLHKEIDRLERDFEQRWSGRIKWAWLWYRGDAVKKVPSHIADVNHGTALELGFRIDHLAGIMFVMVTFIATLIHLFSIGYMSEELQQKVEDHEVHTPYGHLQRRGRFGRFFMFLSLFCFSMLNLVLADNLFQVFLSWELVGVCSYLLIGFYYERTSASNAANKAFITNRVGDAGFLIGMLILWTSLGTLNFQEMFARLRTPLLDAHHTPMGVPSILVRADKDPDAVVEGGGSFVVKGSVQSRPEPGDYVLILPRRPHFHAEDRPFEKGAVHEAKAHPSPREFGYMPYWMLVVAGLGVFLGCVGKSAQFPLQVWLPDAMEGPTPVSALIHAATMVAAGVYLVGRAYPLFTPEVLLTISYVGAITLFVAATIAIVMTDIKKVLAYSTVSQLGYMMLGLGVGGWAAGLFHLVTHAFFKALMFLASGSVIYACHHQQDMLKMGGLYPKMKITALTMLMGVLAIAGVPLFSGWYSKDAIVASAMGFWLADGNRHHALLFVLPLLTAGITTFYMFRMWFLTFTGKPRDEHVYEHASESPYLMTVPLIILAVFSVCVAWPVSNEEGETLPFVLLDAEASWLEHQIHHAQPASVGADFDGHVGMPASLTKAKHQEAGLLALGMVIIGMAFALITYYWGFLDPQESKEQFPGVHRFLTHKWYFDELYSVFFVRPALVVAGWCKNFDLKAIDGVIHAVARFGVRTSKESGWTDNRIVDGLVNLLANVWWAVGAWLRHVQTGYLRSYVLFLALAAAGIWIVLRSFQVN